MYARRSRRVAHEMGLIRGDYGRFAVESRRESFYIHADYDGTALENLWSEYPHPEVDYSDLNDLIAALVDLRDNDSRYAAWRSEGSDA